MAPYSNRKRAIQYVDLISSDDAPINPEPRKIQKSLSANHNIQSQVDPWDQDDEGDANDVIIISQEDSNSTIESYELYGVLRTKIVGVQYYGGYATDGEFVIIRREPSNPYDNNAIRVDNVRREQIGHIPRVMASKLSNYMVKSSSPHM